MSWKWFGVRTLYRTTVKGRPKGVDALYDADATLCETRVVLIRARSFEEAIAKGEAEARRYVKYDHLPNRYGQIVVQTYLGECDAFELFDPPGVGVEVFSRTEVVSRKLSNRRLIQERLGPDQLEDESWRRNKFLGAEYAWRLPEDA